MDKILVSEINLDAKNTKYYVFRLPDYNEKNFYRHTMSFNAFFNSVKVRNRNGRLLYVFSFFNNGPLLILGESTIDKYKQEEIKKNPPIECLDIRDFFLKIGYNYKKKKFEN